MKTSTLKAVWLTAAALLVPLIASPAGVLAAGEGPLVLSLDDAVRLAAENNRDVRLALESRNDLQGRYREERAAAWPKLSLNAQAARSDDGSQDGLGLPTDSGQEKAWLGLSQPVYTWGRITSAVKIAGLGLESWSDELAIARQAAVRDVTAAFYDILLARELGDIAARNLAQKERHLEETRRRHAAGTATDYDILAAEVAVQNARPEIILLDNQGKSARERLRFLLGTGDREVDARGSLDQAAGIRPAYAEALERALKKRPELEQLARGVGMSEELVKLAAAGTKPRIDLQAEAGWNRIEVGDNDGSGGKWAGALVFSFPFFDGGRTRGRVEQERSGLASLRIREQQLRDAIAVQVRDAVNAVQVASETIVALSGTEEQAARLLSMAEQGFEYGVKTRLEVDDANLNLSQARGGLARARRNLAVARVNLAWAMGDL